MARPIWKGTISFGLVSIPVKLYGAIAEAKLDLDMLDKKDEGRIRYKRINEHTGQEVAWSNIVKGYKVNKKYVILEDKDFEKAAAKRTDSIDISAFVKEKEIDPIYYDTTYYLEPNGKDVKPYCLLRTALKKSGMVALGTYVLRNREHLGVIKVYQNALVLTKLHFEEEIRDPQAFDIPAANVRLKPEERKMALSLVEQLSAPFDISKYKDEYTAQLLKFIKAKAKGKMPKIVKKKGELPQEVTTLMDQLKASLMSSSPTKRRKTKKKELN
ncbi:Ku protein [Olivibacter sitiensis]|uniref:non-homologous end joining protein Ku n=1 Tax=Olivibacter sitiensis TaxID=376470 RepID=UPI0004165B4A|nr:Ku protein [Olivibacter sitiensis]